MLIARVCTHCSFLYVPACLCVGHFLSFRNLYGFPTSHARSVSALYSPLLLNRFRLVGTNAIGGPKLRDGRGQDRVKPLEVAADLNGASPVSFIWRLLTTAFLRDEAAEDDAAAADEDDDGVAD